MFLLDGSTCFALLKGNGEIRRKLALHEPSAIRLSALVKAELLQKARASEDVAANLELLSRFFQPFGSLVFDDRCADHYALLKTQADRLNESDPFSDSDLMLAATALVHDLTLVTARPSHFSVVAALPIEDWTRD